MKLYDLSQPLNQEVFFWPYYPPFEVKYIKRKVEHGVNALEISLSEQTFRQRNLPSVDEYALKLHQKMVEIWEQCEKNVTKAQQARKQVYDKKRGKMPNIRINDLVLLADPTARGKFSPPWQEELYKVINLTNTGARIRLHHPDCDPRCGQCDGLYDVSLHRLKLYRPSRQQ